MLPRDIDLVQSTARLDIHTPLYQAASFKRLFTNSTER